MSNLIMRLMNLFSNKRDKMEIARQRKTREELDNRITTLTRVTMNGDDEWMLKLVRRDPSCALKIIKECGQNEHLPVR
jgi:hypothetical protein